MAGDGLGLLAAICREPEDVVDMAVIFLERHLLSKFVSISKSPELRALFERFVNMI
jgi:hypothetical protein